MAVSSPPAQAGVVAAYSATSTAWADGPERIYDVLADELCATTPVPLTGLDVLDVGAGTGAAGRAARRAGARRVIALDAALGMLHAGRSSAFASVGADLLALPLRDDSVDVVIAAFSLNHVDDPARALGEAARVARRAVLASTYAEDDTHPAKAAVEDAAATLGWRPPEWYHWMRTEAVPRLATLERARGAAAAVGLDRAVVSARRITFAGLSPRELVAWRMGMAQLAPFVASLSDRERALLAERAVEHLGAEPPALVRSVIFISTEVSQAERLTPARR